MRALVALFLWLFCSVAFGQAYPAKPVRVIGALAAGQAADIFARMVAERLSVKWGQGVAVENRAGGGGIPGVMAAKQAAPDGHTILVGTSGTLGVNPNIYSSIPYDPLKDFAPASNIFIAPLVLVAHPSFAPNGIKALVAAAKEKPGSINFASAGPGDRAAHDGRAFQVHGRRSTSSMYPTRGAARASPTSCGGRRRSRRRVASALRHIQSGRIKTSPRRRRARAGAARGADDSGGGIPRVSGVGGPASSPPAGTRARSWKRAAPTPRGCCATHIASASSSAARCRPADVAAYSPVPPRRDGKWGEVARAAKVRLD